jgi:cell division protein FtsN
MAKDFTPASTKSADSGGKGRGMPPMLTGIIIGLLMGIMLALGVATWLNRAHNPFLEKSPPVEALPTIASRQVPPPGTKNEKGDAEKPRFEFYQILPGDKGGNTTERAATGTSNVARPSPDTKSASRSDAAVATEVSRPASAEIVFLQAGAFQSQTDAENLKAKIAFSGFEANVRPVNLPDKGTLYRVRLGPYKSADEVNRIKATLSQNGISAAVVKAAD